MELKTRATHGRPVERHVNKADLPKTFEKGRACTREGCMTVLSIYHPGPLCHAHEAKRFPLIQSPEQLERVMAAIPTPLEELEELMSQPPA